MTVRRLLAAALPSLMLLSAALPAAAQNQGMRIGVANIPKIFESLDERKDAQQALDTRIKQLQSDEAQKKLAIQNMKNKLGALKAGSPEYAQLQQQLLKEAIDFDVWAKLNYLQAQQQQKQMIVSLFNKVELAVADVAKKKGYDLILSEQRPDLPDNLENINVDQLKALIGSRTVIFNSQDNKNDVTQDVVILLNAQYHSGGAATQPGK